MDPLTILAAMLHVQMNMSMPMRKCVEIADGILAGAECEVALYRAAIEAEEKAAQPPKLQTDKLQ